MAYVLGSPGWIGFMHGLVVERVRSLGPAGSDLAWSFCEVFTDPPRELSSAGAPIVWGYAIKDGRVTFGTDDRHDVAYRVEFDYQAVLPLGRYDTRGESERAAELGRMASDLRAQGLMRVSGDPKKRDPRLADLHDLIARVTA